MGSGTPNTSFLQHSDIPIVSGNSDVSIKKDQTESR